MKKPIKLTGKILLFGLVLLMISCKDHSNGECKELRKKIKELEQTIAKLENCVIPPLDKPVDQVSLSIGLKYFSQSYYSFFKMRKEVQNIDSSNDIPLNELKPLFLTEGIWFDYNEFKRYIAFIDKNAKEADIDISGIRFFPAISNESGKMTLVYNPTIEKENGNFTYALKKSGNSIRPVLLKDIIPNILNLRKEQNKGSILPVFNYSLTTNDEVQSQAGNRGQLNPPPVEILDINE